ncbi:hypothetical protein JDV02_000174 [Purpureocillium takamizusanense]|uniref:Uncharacterized protein n=1 Tax=Purpureocillium takamizusanense TaxID=2060973 RepID=A0A9Q8Q6J1_9HYPO|nr:uncharacterized protein JDV02_000174 [Purpureocillium takamizusanense]UNI13426.1 hypothetical protein JDV02_000174 [Purpureocillium takamizusanense]
MQLSEAEHVSQFLSVMFCEDLAHRVLDVEQRGEEVTQSVKWVGDSALVFWPVLAIDEHGWKRSELPLKLRIIRNETGIKRVYFAEMPGTDIVFFGLGYADAAKAGELIRCLIHFNICATFRPLTRENSRNLDRHRSAPEA